MGEASVLRQPRTCSINTGWCSILPCWQRWRLLPLHRSGHWNLPVFIFQTLTSFGFSPMQIVQSVQRKGSLWIILTLGDCVRILNSVNMIIEFHRENVRHRSEDDQRLQPCKDLTNLGFGELPTISLMPTSSLTKQGFVFYNLLVLTSQGRIDTNLSKFCEHFWREAATAC